MHQQELLKQQNEQLDQIAEIASRLNNHAVAIHGELGDQNVVLRKLDAEVDAKLEKMNFVMKKLGKLLKTSGKR